MSNRNCEEPSGLWPVVGVLLLVIVLLCWADPDPVICPAPSPTPVPVPSNGASHPPARFNQATLREHRRYVMYA